MFIFILKKEPRCLLVELPNTWTNVLYRWHSSGSVYIGSFTSPVCILFFEARLFTVGCRWLVSWNNHYLLKLQDCIQLLVYARREGYMFFLISIMFLNLLFEYASVFHKSSLTICIKHAYLRSFKRANFMIWPTSGVRDLAEGIKIKKFWNL